jgi:NOL1/NOP2/sun family putative RNA methylase
VTTVLPADYVEEINHLLGGDAGLFWNEVQNGTARAGLRLNTLKTSRGQIPDHLAGQLSPLPWTPSGYEITAGEFSGQNSFHAAGLYYLQEPSAMVPAVILDPQPGEKVLDLCAAPGGKTTQILSEMGNQGLVLANDPNPGRVKALELNINRWGCRNALITCETPRRLAEHFGALFDRVLVDAPCSGEGTFRSHPSEIRKWSSKFSVRCAALQDEILWYAGRLVKPGGKLVYSTCTFNQLENEGTVSRFLDKNHEFSLEPVSQKVGLSPGIPLLGETAELTRAVRIWPHLAPGEGHFAALLSKSFRAACEKPDRKAITASPRRAAPSSYGDFFQSTLADSACRLGLQPDNPSLQMFGNRLYLVPEDSPSLAGLKVQSWGWWIGTLQNERFVPSPALAAGLGAEQVQKVLEFSIDDPELQSYLRGSPFSDSEGDLPDQGWVLVTVASFSLGWGKQHQGKIKSYLPTWLRTP